ncbi:MAG: glycosyltransferase family protein [Gammaproteobacteria bacterium]
MKLIVSHLEALKTYVSREFYYIMRDLISTHGWRHIEICKLWNGAGTIRDKLIDEFGELPGSILFWESYELLSACAIEIYRLDCHKFILADDLHWWDEQLRQRKLVGFALCDTILSTYGYIWARFYPEFSGTKKVVWIPHSASPDFMLPYNRCPENSILLSGAISRHYPLRQQMKALHAQGSHSIAYHGHPGYYTGYDYENDQNIGGGYAKTINRYRAAFTDSLTFNYVVAKYFEIPATGALLFADDAVSGPLRELGFMENRHYLSVSKETLEERIQYVLDERNHEELDEIRRRGQKLVWERHKTSDRARQINEGCSV